METGEDERRPISVSRSITLTGRLRQAASPPQCDGRYFGDAYRPVFREGSECLMGRMTPQGSRPELQTAMAGSPRLPHPLSASLVRTPRIYEQTRGELQEALLSSAALPYVDLTTGSGPWRVLNYLTPSSVTSAVTEISPASATASESASHGEGSHRLDRDQVTHNAQFVLSCVSTAMAVVSTKTFFNSLSYSAPCRRAVSP